MHGLQDLFPPCVALNERKVQLYAFVCNITEVEVLDLTSYSVSCIILELLISEVVLAGDMAAVWQETGINQRWFCGRNSSSEG